ncbi:MAG: tRNA guanosine(15) transglycosylase TgtA [Candidatus Hodarchaeota archaeon]
MFEVVRKDVGGRIGRFEVNGKVVRTPALMPVINPNRLIVSPQELERDFGAEVLITNAYIIWRSNDLRERVESEGIHEFLDFGGVVFTDSGAYQAMRGKELEVDNREIVLFQEKIKPDVGIFLDVPTGDVGYVEAKRTVFDTIERAKECKGLTGDSKIFWACPVQGGAYPDLVSYCAEKVGGLGFDVYCVGSLVTRLEAYEFGVVCEQLLSARFSLPFNRPLHGFGIGLPSFFSLAVAVGCDFFDSAAYALYAQKGRYMSVHGTYDLAELDEFPCSCPLCVGSTPEEVRRFDKDERERFLARHNLYVSFEELRLVRQAIRGGWLWELVQERARSHPRLLEAFNVFEQYPEVERFDPVTKKSAFFYSGPESFLRTEVSSFRRRFYGNYRPEKGRSLVVLPYSESKPFSKFYNVRNTKDIHFAVMTPFVCVPLELENVYPVSQNVFVRNDVLIYKEMEVQFGEFLDRFGSYYDEIKILHDVSSVREFAKSLSPEDEGKKEGNPVWDYLLDLKGLLNFQFGYPAGDILREDVFVRLSKRTGKIREVYDEETLLGILRMDGLFIPSIYCAELLKNVLDYPRSRVFVGDEEVISFIKTGRSVFAKFVEDCDPEIRPKEEVLIVDKSDRLVGVGTSLLSADELLSFDRGVGVKTRSTIREEKKTYEI